MTEAQQAEFERLAKLLIEYLCKNHHPHTTIIITPIHAELLTAETAFTTEEYLRD